MLFMMMINVTNQTVLILIFYVQQTLELGLTHLELAELALTTLEVWNERIPWEKLDEFYSLVLPSLDDYLQSGATADISGSYSVCAF